MKEKNFRNTSVAWLEALCEGDFFFYVASGALSPSSYFINESFQKVSNFMCFY